MRQARPIVFLHIKLNAFALGSNIAVDLIRQLDFIQASPFEPTNRIQVEFTKGQVVIRLAKDGPLVSSKRQGKYPFSISTALLSPRHLVQSLPYRFTSLSANYSDTLSHRHLAGKPMSKRKEGSIFSGGGLLTGAVRLAGYQPAFAIEVNPQYADISEKNHEVQMFNLNVEDAPLDQLPPVELLTLSPPASRIRSQDEETK